MKIAPIQPVPAGATVIGETITVDRGSPISRKVHLMRHALSRGNVVQAKVRTPNPLTTAMESRKIVRRRVDRRHFSAAAGINI
jgi:hypothetical protein